MTLTLCLAILLALCSFGHSQDFQEDVRAALTRIQQKAKLMQKDQTQLKKDVDRLRKELNESLEVVKVDIAELEKDHNEMIEMVEVARDCQDVFLAGGKRSGTYRISPSGLRTMNVYCENAKFGGGWTVIQKRFNGSLSFNKTWQSYSAGFGSVESERWIGLENIYQLTKTKVRQLKIEMVFKYSGVTHYVDYSTFWLKSAAEGYKLNIGGFSSSSLKHDAMDYNNQRQFSTVDEDRAGCGFSCALYFGGGWWFGCCSHSYPNGRYGFRLQWYTGIGYKQLSAVRMMVK